MVYHGSISVLEFSKEKNWVLAMVRFDALSSCSPVKFKSSNEAERRWLQSMHRCTFVYLLTCSQLCAFFPECPSSASLLLSLLLLVVQSIHTRPLPNKIQTPQVTITPMLNHPLILLSPSSLPIKKTNLPVVGLFVLSEKESFLFVPPFVCFNCCFCPWVCVRSLSSLPHSRLSVSSCSVFVDINVFYRVELVLCGSVIALVPSLTPSPAFQFLQSAILLHTASSLFAYLSLMV